ncbi:Proline iminopeptidase [Methylophaga frappieri]|uniref:Proline iminopeptidase n=2 Tax=Methylophaga frappieri (strain ATCC BAA-2434 / DSM 25690 / JAM7) TaxID=754477 RepID=I1YFC7_METFJ|nr:Proline iminopeptidase [Methylophaga frappieri]
MLELYPEIEPFHSEWLSREQLDENNQHEIYVEQCGNPDGIPVLFLHGGPGSGCRPGHRRFFDPARYHIILFDQRGCGRSKPNGELRHNDLPHLIQDIEAIRDHLKISKWMLFGGSWGATLALAYARDHSKNVISMILRGTFLGRREDIDWVYGAGGASKIFADGWHDLQQLVPAGANLLDSYFQLLQDDSAETRQQGG